LDATMALGGSTGHSGQHGHDGSMALGHQHGLGQLIISRASTWPSVITEAMDINTIPDCYQAKDADMALGKTSGLDVIMVLGGSTAHSGFKAHKNSGLSTCLVNGKLILPCYNRIMQIHNLQRKYIFDFHGSGGSEMEVTFDNCFCYIIMKKTMKKAFKGMPRDGAKDLPPAQPRADYPKHPVTMHMVKTSPNAALLCKDVALPFYQQKGQPQQNSSQQTLLLEPVHGG
ncbi:hypothetical protein STEG23_016520, partial [Scotinomys teguina]